MANNLVGNAGIGSKIRIISVATNDGTKRFVVSSESDARRRYVVTRRPGGRRWLCSCKRWIFGVKQPDGTRRRENCKHIRRLLKSAK